MIKKLLRIVHDKFMLHSWVKIGRNGSKDGWNWTLYYCSCGRFEEELMEDQQQPLDLSATDVVSPWGKKLFVILENKGLLVDFANYVKNYNFDSSWNGKLRYRVWAKFIKQNIGRKL